jgi:hypothetical protein
VLAFSGVRVLKNLSLADGSRIEQLSFQSPFESSSSGDLKVLLFTLGLALHGSAVRPGAAPSLSASASGSVKEGTRSSASGSSE